MIKPSTAPAARTDDSHRRRLQQIHEHRRPRGRAEATQNRGGALFLLQVRLDRARNADGAEQ